MIGNMINNVNTPIDKISKINALSLNILIFDSID